MINLVINNLMLVGFVVFTLKTELKNFRKIAA